MQQARLGRGSLRRGRVGRLRLRSRNIGALPAAAPGFAVLTAMPKEASAHEVDHREVDRGFGAVRVGLVVAGQAPVRDLAEGPLDHPAPRNDLETLLGGVAAGDLDIDTKAGAVVDGPGAVAGVGPGSGDPWVGVGDL